MNCDFREFVQLLNDHKVRYLVVRGYAVAFHGHPRYTKDLNIWIEGTSENALRTLSALDEFGFGSLDINLNDFLNPGQVIQLGYPPRRIDLLTSISGVDFSHCFDSRIVTEMEDALVNFINLENLRKNKQASQWSPSRPGRLGQSPLVSLSM